MEDLIPRAETLVLTIAFSSIRIAASFLVLPLFTRENVPVMVRNSFFVILAIIVYPLAFANIDITTVTNSFWPGIILKEMLIGTCLGFLFGSVFWTMSIAGGIIDTQIGANMANMMDPIQGHQTTLTGMWLSQFATWLFMASGGFLIFLDLLMTSYQALPVVDTNFSLSFAHIHIFLNEMEFIMSKALLIAAPAMLILALIDMAFGLINRFAQQINVLALSMPLKSWMATLMFLLSLGIIVETVLVKLSQNQQLTNVLRQLFAS